MDPIKEAFKKIKNDISLLFQEIFLLKEEIFLLKEEILKEKEEKKQKINIEKYEDNKEAIKRINSFSPTNILTKKTFVDKNPAHQHIFQGLKDPKTAFSIGNEGVPTDRQTDRQTDIPTQKLTVQERMEDIDFILNSLDSLKKEIRIKFKRLTEQEFLVFSQIYQEEEEKGFTDYKTLSRNLNLTESSIRDYVGKLIKKGIPVDKKRINNKTIHLSISPQLKKITTLSTILKLREL